MNGGAAQYGYWGNDSRVEEVETGEDEGSDSEEIGLPARRNRHYAGSSLSASATDLGDQAGSIVQRRLPYQIVDDENEEDLGSTEEDDDYNDFTPDMEEALVQSALLRISRAQARGRTDVKLNQDEIAALERRRQRMEEEERRQRKKRKEQRVAVPLSQFESFTRRTRISRQGSGDEPPEPPVHQTIPPMGYFPPPAGSRSGSQEDAWPVAPNHDPFQYQTEGPKAAYPTGAAVSGPRRHGSSGSGGSASSDLSYRPGRSATGSIADWSHQGSRKGSPGTSEVDNEEATEGNTGRSLRRGVQTRASARSIEHVAADMEPGTAAAEPGLSRQSSKKSTSPRRKSVGAGVATTTNARGGASVRGATRGRGGASVRGTLAKKK
ncbi:hypothetical protein PT974_08610 [Cladobotryum mycophilum]|uniref:Prenylated Rab acceptor 1 n=1 Tax=Cladobotryum mycophilum TaxID=491253 RepID=A0ABR0SDV2_9HYPO